MVLGCGAGERDVSAINKHLAQVVVVVDDVTTVLSGSVPRSRLVGNRELTSRCTVHIACHVAVLIGD